ncbi:GDP-mannose mannosyl hydrolase [Escherichia coli]|uniref:GDP-mannose mannosyl hydrolase n=1 Tax=Escherichia coli TaxID=562 RepID=A0AAW5Z153_ECOLX|nr:GDP-mannose mannosyl hydrolase [Escherichia coli]EFB2449775.1 GDP-mannose mannosyl hydrolase [Escherichia coli]EFB4403566.1 GDP-mannose mannosyl hydrolase [Escherichia coli]EFB4781169.1 GDP-mannose mannosyl hydrolase [Escherichia coli]EFE9365215.1 GDP-mannose mannosyl hydrolase [Escherichia coli]EFH4185260.1 GDP-mannose mannosyl hydrolase [Escherichia coli]
MFVPSVKFREVIQLTPLISIDLLIENENGEYLFGLRNNRPAKNKFFVPGGRIRKNESIENAFKRISFIELGKEYDISKSFFNGVWEHFYDDSFFSDVETTHYIVLCYKLKVLKNELYLPDNQHSEYLWISEEQIINFNDIHEYSKNYFL